jgi:hypothetical protein
VGQRLAAWPVMATRQVAAPVRTLLDIAAHKLANQGRRDQQNSPAIANRHKAALPANQVQAALANPHQAVPANQHKAVPANQDRAAQANQRACLDMDRKLVEADSAAMALTQQQELLEPQEPQEPQEAQDLIRGAWDPMGGAAAVL